MEVKAIDDWMVDGTRVRKSSPGRGVGQEDRDEYAGGEAEQREDDEGAGEHGDVEPPVPQAVHRLTGGEPGAVEEEEEGDRGGGGTGGDIRARAVGRQQRREAHRPEQQQDVRVDRHPTRPSQAFHGAPLARSLSSEGRGTRSRVPAPSCSLTTRSGIRYTALTVITSGDRLEECTTLPTCVPFLSVAQTLSFTQAARRLGCASRP